MAMTAENPTPKPDNDYESKVRPLHVAAEGYPELSFYFDAEKILGKKDSPMIPTHDDRVRAVFRALHDATNQREDLPEQPDYAPAVATRNNAKQRWLRFKHTKVTIVQDGNRERISRAKAVNRAEVVDEVLKDLAAENHPVAQGLCQFGSEFSKIGKEEILDVQETVLGLTFPNEMRNKYLERVDARRVGRVSLR